MLLACAAGGCAVVPAVAQKADRLIAPSEADRALRLKYAWSSAAGSCVAQPGPELALLHPVCARLLMRGQELECLAGRLREEAVINHYPSPDGLLNWENCVKRMSRTLADGYYLGPREIERELQLCEASIEASPVKPAEGYFSRLFGNENGPPAWPSTAEFGAGGRQAPTGLLKCAVLWPPASVPTQQNAVASPVVRDGVEASTSPQAKPKPTVATERAKAKRRSQKNAGTSKKKVPEVPLLPAPEDSSKEPSKTSAKQT
jgi:hypothetical protein